MSIHHERPRAAADLADEALRYLDAVDVFASLDADPHADARARAACARAREERAAQQATPTARKVVLRMAELTQLSVWPVAQQPARAQRRAPLPARVDRAPGQDAARARAHDHRLPTASRASSCSTRCAASAPRSSRRSTSAATRSASSSNHAGPRSPPRNVLLAREQGAAANALALRGDARRLGRGLLDELAGSVALILTSPPYGPLDARACAQARQTGSRSCNDRYSRNPDNLAHLPARPDRASAVPASTAALGEILAGCERMLAPAGSSCSPSAPTAHSGALVDLPGRDRSSSPQSAGLDA